MMAATTAEMAGWGEKGKGVRGGGDEELTGRDGVGTAQFYAREGAGSVVINSWKL